MTMMGASLIKQGHDRVAGFLLSDEMEEKAKIRAKVGEAKWEAMKDKERKKAELQFQKDTATNAGITSAVTTADNSLQNITSITLSTPDAKSTRDPLK